MTALTVRGRAFIAAGITTTTCAIVLGYDALMRVGVLAVALPLITAALVGRARHRLMARRSIDPVRVVCRQRTEITLHLMNQGRLPAGLLLFEDHLPAILGSPQRFTVDRMGPSWRRTVTYSVMPPRRGHYEIGPLSVRISDPFGFIELTRSFRSSSRLVVIPRVVPLPSTPLTTPSAESGERRLRAASSGSAEDVTVREYRRGDDLRRVHWRSTARVGELMVRREEEPWQNRATLILDTRQLAHTLDVRGTLEWAVDATASIGAHLSAAGYFVQLLTERPTTSNDVSDTPETIVDELAAMTPSDRTDFSELAGDLAPPRGLVVAVVGRCLPRDVEELNRQVSSRVRRLVILLEPAGGGTVDEPAPPAQWLTGHGWQVVAARADEPIAQVWARLAVSAEGGPVPPRSAVVPQ